MAHFELNGKEYDLKLTYKAMIHLNKTVDGGALGLVGKAMAGDLEVFAHIVHAGLFHHGQNFSFAEVESAIEEAIEKEKLDLEEIYDLSNSVVTDSFFYKAQVKKLLADNPEALKQIEKLRK